ncbi:DUF3854 domain-containing protein [Victivallis vadensis]|uniref:DUF3854 domain-containing protein n=1 Tax=Victivallis vadensis TaxID=172901 RepID=A0A848AZE4_9BACT|nr:phage/plasmid primase, P4 family [Victivallis vadensis]NMD87407.1 DUF3854 domain-containing protein [Victivallis vadensis]
MENVKTDKKVTGAVFPGYMIDDFEYVSSISNIHPNSLTCNEIKISTVQTGMDHFTPTAPTVDETEEWARRDLQNSGIDWNEFCSFGGKLITSEAEFHEYLDYEPSCLDGKAVGWLLPFYNPKNGEELIGADGMPYFRIRMRYPAQTSGEKPAKYLSRKNAGQHAFILATVHKQLAHDPKAPLILTEGEKKAWCATNHGMPTIGLTGNFGWSLSGTKELLPELVEYLNKERPVYVIWDSDARNNRMFQSSTRQLATALQPHGCTLKEIILPALPNNKKTGLDDYIMQLNPANLFESIASQSKIAEPDKRSITSKANGALGGRLVVTKDIADEIASEWLDDKGRKLLAYYRGSFYEYKRSLYTRCADEDMDAKIMSLLRKKAPENATPNMLKSVKLNFTSTELFYISSRAEIPCDRDTGASLPQIIHLQNGYWFADQIIQEIRDGKSPVSSFKANTPEIFDQLILPVEYKADADCPKFKKYLEEVQPDPEIRHMLQCLMGLSLIPDTSRNVIFFLYGEGGCGKSVFIEVLRNLVGVENCCCVPLARFTDRFRCIDLTKSLLNIIGDMPTDDGTTAPHNIEGMMKDAADGGSIPVEEKFKTPYTAKVTARSIFATNSLPHFTDRTQALQDRLRIIPFMQRFRGTKTENPHLRDELIREELSGIFNFALQGLAELSNHRTFPEPEVCKKIKMEHFDSCITERAFIKSHVERAKEDYVFKCDLYRAFKAVCQDEGRRPVSAMKFAEELARCFPELREEYISVPPRKAIGWRGIRLVSERDGE